jgi:hypothetical protein
VVNTNLLVLLVWKVGSILYYYLISYMVELSLVPRALRCYFVNMEPLLTLLKLITCQVDRSILFSRQSAGRGSYTLCPKVWKAINTSLPLRI